MNAISDQTCGYNLRISSLSKVRIFKVDKQSAAEWLIIMELDLDLQGNVMTRYWSERAEGKWNLIDYYLHFRSTMNR